MRRLFVATMTSASLGALIAPATAFAQTSAQVPAETQTGQATPEPGADPSAAQPAPDSGAGGDIIVTARRRDERLQDVPAVVNAVTSDQIARLNFRDFREVQTVVPGLQLRNNANGIGSNAQLRGVNFDINASGFNSTVEFYFDDAPITAGIILTQLYDVGQIEVLRGPQGTLRGRASPSGSITVTSHKPDLNRFGGFVDLTGNDIGTINAQAGINVPIIPGMLAVRAAGVINQDNADNVRPIARGIPQPAGDGRDPYSETSSYRGSAVFAPFDFLRFEGVYQHVDSYRRFYNQVESFNLTNASAPASPTTIRGSDRRSDSQGSSMFNQYFDIYNGRAELALAGQQLIYQYQRSEQKIFSNTNNDFANFFPTTALRYRTNTRSTAESHEVRLQNQERVGGFLDYVAGFFLQDTSSPTNLTTPTPVTLFGALRTVALTPVVRPATSHERSFFGNVVVHIGDQNAISGGVRVIHESAVSQLFVNGALLTNERPNSNHTIYNASLQHFFTPDIMVYASTGTSFRPSATAIGDFNVASSARERGFLRTDPETSTSYEIGLKSQLFDHHLRFNISGYHQRFNNYPYRAPGSGVFYVNTVATRDAAGNITSTAQQVGSFNFIAAVPVEVNGVEGDLALDLGRRFNLGATASYSLGKIRNGTIACVDLNGDGIPDAQTAVPTVAQLNAATGGQNVSACRVTQRSAFQSPFSASVQAEYHQPITGGTDGYIRGLVSFNGRSQGDPTNAYDQVDAYALFNLYAGLRAPDGSWEVNFYAKNLFDDDRVLTRTTPLITSYQALQPPTFRTALGQTATSTYVGVTTTPEREFGVNFRYRFGSR